MTSILPLTTCKLVGEILEIRGFVFLWRKKQKTKTKKNKKNKKKSKTRKKNNLKLKFAVSLVDQRQWGAASRDLIIKQIIKWGGKKWKVETAWHSLVFHLKIYNQKNKLYNKIKSRMTFWIFFSVFVVLKYSVFPLFHSEIKFVNNGLFVHFGIILGVYCLPKAWGGISPVCICICSTSRPDI